MNITDVGHLSSDSDTGEDKMVKSAKKAHKSVLDIAKFYTEAFFEDFKKLNIKKPETVEPATNLIDDWKTIRESVRFYRAKGHSVRVLKGEIDIKH